MKHETDTRGPRPLILGAARSGLALARLIRARGGEPLLADARLTRADLPADLRDLPFLQGEFRAEWLADRDALVLSPGVPLNAPAVGLAREAGLRVSGEIEEAYRLAGAPVLAVTGTNGKSTTTTLLSLLLEQQGYVAPAGGNLGRPFSELVEQVPDADFYVVEISSFQCETFDRFRPFAAALLNLTPDHLDRYGDFESYAAAKLRLFENMGLGEHVIHPDGEEVRRRLTGCPARRWDFSLSARPERGAWLEKGVLCLKDEEGIEAEILPAAEMRLVGRHNVANALAAVALALPCGVSPEAMAAVLRRFPGLPHRMEDLGEHAGLRCYNDSKATNVEATQASLGGLDASILLIAGGKDKGGDFAGLAASLPRVRRVYGIGDAGEMIVAAFGERGRYCGDLPGALAAAREEGRAGELLILSPACASFDQYRDFEERGDHMRRLLAEASC